MFLLSLSAAYVLFLSERGLKKIDFALKRTMSYISVQEKLENNCNRQSAEMRFLCCPLQQSVSLWHNIVFGDDKTTFTWDDCGVICNLDALLWKSPPSAANKC